MNGTEKQYQRQPAAQDEGFDIEPILQALGRRGLGLYQVTQMVLQFLSLPGAAISVMSIVFIGYQPPYRCASVNTSTVETLIGWDGNNSSAREIDIEYEKCQIRVSTNQSGQMQYYSLPCVEGFEYDGGKHTSLFTEWDLTCGKEGLTELTQTMMMVGQGVGAAVFTSIADRFGRKPVHVTCTLGMLVVNVAMALSPNYLFFVICRTATGAIQQGSGLVSFTMFIELSPKWLRGAAGVIDGTLWASIVMLLPLLAYLLQDFSWRYLQFLIAAFSAYSIFLPCILDESLRWLVANGKKAEAALVLKRACRRNGVQYKKVYAALETLLKDAQTSDCDNNRLSEELSQSVNGPELSDENTKEISDSLASSDKTEPLLERNEYHSGNGSVDEKLSLHGTIHGENAGDKRTAESAIVVRKYTLLDVIRTRVLLKTTVIICFLWISNNLTYYGLILTSSSLAGNRFFNFFLQAAMEFPACVMVYFCLRKFGRRTVTCAFLSLTACALGLSSVLLLTVKSSVIGILTNVLSLIGKFGITGSFCAIFIYCPELFPTNLRSAGLGIASSIARFGAMVAPFSQNLADIALWAPGIIFGAMTTMSAFIVMMLPETRGRPLPTTIEDVQAWHNEKSKQMKTTVA